MADLDERLNQLLSDQDTVNRILELAKMIQAQRDSQNPEPLKPPQTPLQQTAEPDLSALLTAVMSSHDTQASPQSDTASTIDSNTFPSPLVALLPQLMQAMSGQGNLIKSERVNLIQAMRPYLKENRLQSIDRAIKMANVTKAATSAIHLLGR